MVVTWWIVAFLPSDSFVITSVCYLGYPWMCMIYLAFFFFFFFLQHTVFMLSLLCLWYMNVKEYVC